MQPLEEKDSSPLEDSEITRLLKVSRELGYKKQDKIPERNLADFKPTSITQIATSSGNDIQEPINRAETSDSAKTAQNDYTSDNIESHSKDLNGDTYNLGTKNTEPNLQINREQREMSDSTESSSTSSEESLESSSMSVEAVEEDPPKENGPGIDTEQGTPVEKNLVEETPDASIQDQASKIEEAKQEGIEVGKKLAVEEIGNKQQDALETFQSIIDNIKKKEIIDKTDLTRSILKVVTRLASERAGNSIDEHPEAFKNKIISFVDKIEQESKTLILNLNPKDADLLKGPLTQSLGDKKVELRENSELFRGDFIFQMGAVEIGDLISKQIQIEETKKTATIKRSKPEKDSNNLEKKVGESDDIEDPQNNEKSKMSKIENDSK